MFRNALLTSVVSLLLMCVSSMVVLAQDSLPDDPISESRLNMTVITATAVLQNDRETIQQLRNAGFTSEEIEGIRSTVVARDASSYSGSVCRIFWGTEVIFLSMSLWRCIKCDLSNGTRACNCLT